MCSIFLLCLADFLCNPYRSAGNRRNRKCSYVNLSRVFPYLQPFRQRKKWYTGCLNGSICFKNVP
ncbi:hypothetical protein CLOSTASPAR_00019 [[Clostridium] asparagiforme DSM 15981]|uniref:Uncharacterized protein n=1 Tax=[Clostridium] asparagiforme DSM 15981 TaxID=518636 RepID=C0CSS5_9FIRM|nr:hypothetical protein CLOSTASPAR_00019 [[Clostridium] asparagiforme DSM 15981]